MRNLLFEVFPKSIKIKWLNNYSFFVFEASEEATITKTKSLIKRFKNSVPCLFVWFLLIACNTIYYATVWPSLVTVIGMYHDGYLSFGIVLAIKIYLLIAITVNLFLSTFSDPGQLPRSTSMCDELVPSTQAEKSLIVVNVYNQSVELKWCSVC